MRAACLSLALAFTSCGGEPAPVEPVPPTTATAAATEPSHDSPSSTVPSGAEAPPPGASAPPTLALLIRGAADGVGLSIANHGAADVSLRSSVVVEIDEGGSFHTAPSTSTLALRYDCAHEPDPCVTLAPGAELIPPSWLGTWGDMQCVCTRCAPVEPGNYRLVVTTCDGVHRIESNALSLPVEIGP